MTRAVRTGNAKMSVEHIHHVPWSIRDSAAFRILRTHHIVEFSQRVPNQTRTYEPLACADRMNSDSLSESIHGTLFNTDNAESTQKL